MINQSTSEGRFGMMLRIRPTLLQELRQATIGPAYIVIEYAIERLLDDLEKQSPGTLLTVNALDYNPTPQDAELLETMPRMRPGKPRKAKNDAAG